MMRILPAAVLLGVAPAFVVGLLVGRRVARAGDDLLAVGSPAPDLEGKDASGAPVKLSSQKGRFAIVYFYPKDDTPGCTKEACAFRDSFDKFGKAGVTIFGVSRDDEASHKAFRDKYKLPFVLVADNSKAAQHAYHVPGLIVASRVSFLVGPDGKIARVWPKVDPVVHANEVLGAVASLDPKRGH
jgi:peroxiredoxin Q/BCP